MGSPRKPSETLAAQLNALRAGYLAELPAKAATVEATWLAARHGNAAEAAQLRSLVHNLAGSGAVFGCREVSIAAAALERELDCVLERGALTAGELAPLEPLVAAVVAACHRAANRRVTAEETASTSSDSSRPSPA